MTQTRKSPCTWVYGEAVSPFRRVKFSNTMKLVYADQVDSDNYVGWSGPAGGEEGLPGMLILRGETETVKAEAADSFDAGATLYAANDGKVSDSASGNPIGTALEAAGGAGEVVEVLATRGTGSIPGAASIQNYSNTDGGIPFLVKASCTADAPGDEVVIASFPRKAQVVDAWMVSRDTNAADVTIKNGSDAITDAKAKGTADAAIVRFGSIIAAADEIAAKDAINATFSAAGAVDVFLLCVPIA